MKNRFSKLLGIFLCMTMFFGMIPSGFVLAAGETTITLATPTMPEGTASFDVVCANVQPNDWICIYGPGQEIGKAAHSGWMDAKEGTVTFSTETMNPDRYANTPGGWPLKAGEWQVVLFANYGYTEIRDQKTLVVTAAENPGPDEPKSSFTASAEEIEAGGNITFTYSGAENAKDWVAIYRVGDSNKYNYLDWSYLETRPDGTITFPTAANSKEDWINTPGEYVAKFLKTDSQEDDFLIAPPVYFTVSENNGNTDATVVYVSNKYGDDGNDGLTDKTAKKTLAGAISAIGISNDGTVVVLDGKDSSGNAEYEVYTRGSDWASPIYGGTQNVLQYVNVPAHTGTITYIGDAVDSVICFGANHLELKGPTIFENITLIEGYNVGKQIVTGGNDLSFNKNVLLINTRITGDSQTKPANGGLGSPGGTIAIDIAGRYNVSKNGTVSLTTGRYGEVAFGGWDNNRSISENQKIYVGGDATVKDIKLRNSSGDWTMKNLSVVIDGGTVGYIADVGKGNAEADAVQIIFNNGISVDYTPTGMTLGKGEWVISAENDGAGSRIDVTDDAGVFAVEGGRTAIAQDKSGASYVSENGKLTLPAGSYSVCFTDNAGAESIIVKYDGIPAEGTYIKGSKIVLPMLEDKIDYTFGGWNCSDGAKYEGGATVTLPKDADEIEFTSIWNIIRDLSVVYVDPANGSDTNSGASAAEAFKSLAKATAKADSSQDANKAVVIIGKLDIPSGGLPAHKNMITFMGDDSGNSSIGITSESIGINGPATFKNIDFRVEVNSKFIESGANELVFDSGVTVSTAPGKKVNLHLGTMNVPGEKEKAVISSGEFSSVYVGAYYNTQQMNTAGADIVVNGGNIGSVWLGADGWLETQQGVRFTEDVNITVNGGSVAKVTATSGSRAPVFDKNLQIIFNNGIKSDIGASYEVAGGYWVINSENAGGCALRATDVAGEFEVAGGLTAIAAGADGVGSYVSASGILSIPDPGVYNVTYTDKVYYTNSGTEVIFYDDYTVNFDDLRHTSYDGKLFVGWADKNGGKVTKTSFAAGEKLYAQYVDFDSAVGGDFSIIGAQARTSGKPGLRFVVEKTDAITERLDASEYGTVIIPSEILGTEELKLGESYTYGGKSYDSKTVIGEKTFELLDGGIRYTVCVTDMPQELYRRQYTVRGYIKYNDYNGKDRVLYTDYYSANLYMIAKEALKDEAVTGEAREYLNSVVKYVDETLKQEYLNQNKIDIVGTSADPDTWIYQLSESGVMIREVEIDSGKGGEAVEIVQLSDTHFNYCNDRDFEEANPATMSTWQNRTAFRYPGTQNALNKSIEYASYSDQIIITGDAIDYLSWGCIELLNKYVWDPYPDTLIALGNHEPVRQMQGTVSDPSSLESRYQILQDNWKHDIYYTSKILTDDNGVEKVMVVQMDNSQNKYWDRQIPLFEADIETAREKQIPLLVFGHTPLSTRNPEDSAHYALRKNDGSGDPANFYTSFIGYNASGASKTIYDLITMNPDVIKGYFCGHWHCDYYTEIWSKNADGTDNPDVVIPQYILTGSAYDKGHALKITVK